jgi:uncharacterized protein YqeY
MGIEEKINADIKASMLAKDAKRLDAVRALKSVVLLLKTSAEGLTEEGALKAIRKECKKRTETAEIYTQQNRPDLAQEELSQATIMEEYLPKQMSEEEIGKAVEQIIIEIGAKSPGDMGKVMGGFSAKYAGKADGKIVSNIVKELLLTKA